MGREEGVGVWKKGHRGAFHPEITAGICRKVTRTYQQGSAFAMVGGGLSTYTMFVEEARSVSRTFVLEIFKSRTHAMPFWWK